LWFIVPITLFVLGLIVYVAVKFRASVNPVPSKTSHHTMIEVVWTVAPVVILLFIAVPSFQLLSAQYDPPEEPTMTIKATGFQWYWGYEYQMEAADGAETAEVRFDQFMLQDADRAGLGKEDIAQYPRLLAVDNEIVVPVNETVRLLVTAGDVLHSWTLFRAVSTRRGSAPSAKASITASAPSYAARITPICPLPSASYRRTSMTSGSSQPLTMSVKPIAF
jgi:cytochrome c oxidase subunit II